MASKVAAKGVAKGGVKTKKYFTGEQLQNMDSDLIKDLADYIDPDGSERKAHDEKKVNNAKQKHNDKPDKPVPRPDNIDFEQKNIEPRIKEEPVKPKEPKKEEEDDVPDTDAKELKNTSAWYDRLTRNLPCVLLFIGKSKSGKSHAIEHICRYMTVQNKFWKFGICMLGSHGASRDYRWMPKKYVLDGFQPDFLEKYVEKMKKFLEEKQKDDPDYEMEHSFLILDDCLGQIKGAYWDKFVSWFRHLNITILISTQYLKARNCANTLMREQSKLVFLWPSGAKNTINGAFEWWGSGQFNSLEDFKERFRQKTSKPYQCMLIESDNNNAAENFIGWKAPKGNKNWTLAKSEDDE